MTAKRPVDFENYPKWRCYRLGRNTFAQISTWDNWFFRISGWGLLMEDHRLYPMKFSEREGLRRGLHIGPWCIQVLRP